jgi:hypothetical protein
MARSPATLLFVLVLALVTGLAAWLLWTSSEGEPFENPRGGANAVAAGSETEQNRGRMASAKEPGKGTGSGEARAEGPGRHEIAPTKTIEIPDGEALDILVVDGDTDAPVPDATVLFGPQEYSMGLTPAERKRLERGEIDIEYCLRKSGFATRSDASGRARVRRFPVGVHVVALTAGHYGRLHIQTKRPQPEAGWVVHLLRDYTIEVTVVDANGEPAVGVRVSLAGYWSRPDGGEDRLVRTWPVRTRAPDGMFVRRHAYAAPARAGTPSFGQARDTHLIVTLPGMRLTVPVQFADEAHIRARVELPPTGRIRVTIVDGEGNAMPAVERVAIKEQVGRSTSVLVGEDGVARFDPVGLGREFTLSARAGGLTQKLDLAGPTRAGETIEAVLAFPVLGTVVVRIRSVLGKFSEKGRPYFNLRYESGRYLTGRLVDANGEYVVSHVPVGKTWKVQCDLYNHRLEKTFTGPRASGERVEVELSAGAEAAILTGRALDETGNGLPIKSLKLEFRCESNDMSLHATTDDGGCFAVGIPKRFVGKQIGFFELRMLPDDDCAGRIGKISHDQALAPGERDVGDVVLAPLPLVVAGRVVGIERQPHYGEQIELHVEGLHETVKDGEATQAWRRERLHRRWLEGTSFEVRGTPTAGRLRLVLECTRSLPVPPIAFAAGTKDLEVRVQKGGVLQPRVLASAGIPVKRLILTLTATRGDMPQAELGQPRVPTIEWHPGPAGSGTLFYWKRLYAGEYRLEVRAAGVGRVAVFEQVLIEAGKENQDPRLHPLDLRGKLRSILFTILGPDGKVPAQARRGIVIVGDRSGAGDLEGYAFDYRGKAHVVTPDLPVRACIRVPGYQLRELFNLTEDTTVRLEPALEVHVRWPPGGTPELPPGRDLLVALVNKKALSDPKVDVGGLPVRRFHYLGGRRTAVAPIMATAPQVMKAKAGAVFHVMEPGEYVARVWINPRQRQRAKPALVDLGARPPFRIEVTGSPQQFELRVSQQAIDAALAK